MKTFILAKIALLPITIFWILSASQSPQTALLVGFASLVAISTLQYFQGKKFHLLEISAGVFLAAFSAMSLLGLPVNEVALPASFATLGLTGLWTVINNQPWTAEYSAKQYQENQKSPLFIGINKLMSLLWSVIFLLLAALNWFQAPAWSRTTILTLGAIATLVGPLLLIKFFLQKKIDERERFKWKTTTLTQPSQNPDHYDAVIIGAGMGGLTTAALLAQAGKKVFVAEQHVYPGGYCHSWERKVRTNGETEKFRFDSGVHDFSGFHEGGSMNQLLQKLGIDSLEFHHNTRADFSTGVLKHQPQNWQGYLKDLQQQHPDSSDALANFFALAKPLYEGLYHGSDKTSGIPLKPQSVKAMMEFAKAQPELVHWMEKPFSELLDHFPLSHAARESLYQLAGYVTDNRDNLVVVDMIPLYGYYFNGGHYPLGGSSQLGDAFKAHIESHGGTVALRTAVDKILVENNAACGIRLSNGEEIRATTVVSNADLKRTLIDLLPEDALSAEHREEFSQIAPATSAFMVHLALKAQPNIPDIIHKVYRNDLRVGITSPSASDPSAAPEGFGTIELISQMPQSVAESWFANIDACDDKQWRFSDDYKQRKQAFGDAMIAAAAQVIPDLEELIIYRCDASPVTFQRYDWASGGSIYGVSKEDRYYGHKSPVPNLWICGSANLGAGIEAVMIAGARVAAALAPECIESLEPNNDQPIAPSPANEYRPA